VDSGSIVAAGRFYRSESGSAQIGRMAVRRLDAPIGATWRRGLNTITPNRNPGMARGLQIAWVAGVAACGTLLGHAVAYALEGRSLADGHHGYFRPMLEVVLASALLRCLLIVRRAITSQALGRMHALPPFPRLWFIVASLQIVGFVMIELLESNAPDALGCGVEVLMALLVAVTITLFCRVVERCAQTMLYAYAQRLQSSGASPRRLPLQVDAARSLAVCAGVHRFKRPPPLIG